MEAVLASKERGLGLFGMQERMTLVGGRLQLSAWQGGGTLVRAEVPLDEVGARLRPCRGRIRRASVRGRSTR